MSSYVFPGFTVFLEEAARRVGKPEAARPARRDLTLSALANLCAQAGTAGSNHAPAILAKASEFRDELLVAYQAAELMLEEVHQALGLDTATGRDAPSDQTPGTRQTKRKKA